MGEVPTTSPTPASYRPTHPVGGFGRERNTVGEARRRLCVTYESKGKKDTSLTPSLSTVLNEVTLNWSVDCGPVNEKDVDTRIVFWSPGLH